MRHFLFFLLIIRVYIPNDELKKIIEVARKNCNIKRQGQEKEFQRAIQCLDQIKKDVSGFFLFDNENFKLYLEKKIILPLFFSKNAIEEDNKFLFLLYLTEVSKIFSDSSEKSLVSIQEVAYLPQELKLEIEHYKEEKTDDKNLALNEFLKKNPLISHLVSILKLNNNLLKNFVKNPQENKRNSSIFELIAMSSIHLAEEEQKANIFIAFQELSNSMNKYKSCVEKNSNHIIKKKYFDQMLSKNHILSTTIYRTHIGILAEKDSFFQEKYIENISNLKIFRKNIFNISPSEKKNKKKKTKIETKDLYFPNPRFLKEKSEKENWSVNNSNEKKIVLKTILYPVVAITSFYLLIKNSAEEYNE